MSPLALVGLGLALGIRRATDPDHGGGRRDHGLAVAFTPRRQRNTRG
jgi:hypothetical protein